MRTNPAMKRTLTEGVLLAFAVLGVGCILYYTGRQEVLREVLDSCQNEEVLVLEYNDEPAILVCVLVTRSEAEARELPHTAEGQSI